MKLIADNIKKRIQDIASENKISDSIIFENFKYGFSFEEEHVKTIHSLTKDEDKVIEVISNIVLDHLSENKNYYEDLAKMEAENKVSNLDNLMSIMDSKVKYQGYSLKELYDEVIKFQGSRDGALIFSEFIKRKKDEGDTKIMDEFNRTSFVENINPVTEQEESIPDLIEGLKVLADSLEGAEKKEIEDVIEGLEILLDSLEGEEKKDLEDTIEGLKLLLDSDKFKLGGLIEYGNSFGKIIKEDDGVYTIETENGDIKEVLIKYSTPYREKEPIKSNNDYGINKYENNLGKLSENQKQQIINKIGLFDVDLFFKSHKTLKNRKEVFNLFNKNEENIKDIQSKRHILHSTNEEDLFNSSNSLYSREFNDNVSIVADDISEIKIIGIENKFNGFIKDFDDSEIGNRSSDIDLEYLDEDIDLDDEKIRLLNLIKIEKEELNFAIELYLSYLDEVWDRLNLDEFKDNYHWKKKDFKPSGFLRNRLL